MDAPTTAPTAAELTALETSPTLLEPLLEALRAALAQPGEHRLFRSGKLPGLFHHRSGPAADAATFALRHDLLRITRRETRGKIVTEWVQPTPRAVAFLHRHDSPQSLLREWKRLLDLTAAGLPAWLEQTRAQLDRLARDWQERTTQLLEQLHALGLRLDAALRRYELDRTILGEPLRQIVPWAADALEYLDQRAATAPTTPCTLPELFAALVPRHPQLDIAAFHQGLIHLHELRLLRLLPHEPVDAPEFLLLHRGQLFYAVVR